MTAHPLRSTAARTLRDPIAWTLVALLALALGMNRLAPLFAAVFPALDHPIYTQESFGSLLLSHVWIVGVSSGIAVLTGLASGVFATRQAGQAFRPTIETIVALGQTVPPVAVLALAVPLLGFGDEPAIIALALYGLLPVVRATIAGIESIPRDVREAAQGLGLGAWRILRAVELPLALPVLLGGIRTSVIINIGTATIASAVGARTLGTPIIVGLNGFNTAYVIQGATVVALLAVVTDLLFARWQARLSRWRAAAAPGPQGSDAG
jgi:osmoprotectant transport system permease protein